MTSDINQCYRALEVEPGASREQVKQAWRELVKVWHPDRFPNDARLQRKALERLKEINGAHEVLERYFAAGNPPPQSRTSSYRTYDDSQWQDSQQSNSERQSTETPPPQPPPSPTEPGIRKSPISLKGIVWAGIGLVTLVLIIWDTSRDSSNPISSLSQTYVLPPISRVLDEKNGFKDFAFGMTPQEARKTLPPSLAFELPGSNVTKFTYRATSLNRIGDYSIGDLDLAF